MCFLFGEAEILFDGIEAEDGEILGFLFVDNFDKISQ